MKTNRRKPFILATLALGLVLVMGLGANTFAKYVTGAGGEDEARVAKFGYTVTAAADLDAFAGTYKFDADALETVDGAGSIDVSVDASGDNLVAPGTTGSFTFAIAGTAEVAVSITTDIAADFVAPKLIADADESTVVWEPVKWTLVFDPADGSADQTLVNAGNVAALQAAIDALDVELDPNEACELNGTYTVTWEWAFETTDMDEEDTLLGWLAAGANGTATADYDQYSVTDLSLGFDITIEQIQR